MYIHFCEVLPSPVIIQITIDTNNLVDVNKAFSEIEEN